MTREEHLDKMKNEGNSGNACVSYVHSRVTLYHASKVDLRYCRTLHSCDSCRLGQVEDICGAVHFGICAAVASPAPKMMRRGSGSSSLPASPNPSSPGSPAMKYGNPVYQSFANFASPTGGGAKSRTRSLAILREGHELAGMHQDSRSYSHQPALMRLHPQRQVIVQGHNIRIGSGGATVRQPGSDWVVSSDGGKARVGGGGVAITIQRGQANITSGGNTAIKIQGSGHEIRIQGSGGQNIQVQPTVGAGGLPGHVIRIHGHGPQGHPPHPLHIGARPGSVTPPVDAVDSHSAPAFLGPPKSYSSIKQFQPQKPTARVAPAPVPPPIITQTNVYTPATAMLTSPPLISPPCPSSPTYSQETPPFPVCSPISSVPDTPLSSPPPSPTPPTSPVAAVFPTTKQPVISVSNKDKEVGSNHVGQTTLKPTGDIIKDRQDTGLKDVSGHAKTDGLLQHQANEVYPSNRKLHGKDVEVMPQLSHQRLPEPPPEASRISAKVDARDKENKVKKRSSRPISNVHIPHFYFPLGKPGLGVEIEAVLQKISQAFGGFEGGKAYKQQMGVITKACGLPHFWKILLFRAAGGTSDGYITYQNLSVLVRKLYQSCHDDASKFIRLAAKPGTTVLEFDDFEPLVQDVVETHPGLTFLQDAPEFHSRYVTTVISRIMFCVNRSWTGKIILPEMRKSTFLPTLARLEQEEDINQIKDYFSYEHFYVIYCKFWELDKDHDLFIDKNDLSRHNDHALNSRLVDRIFSGAVTRGSDFHDGRMSYKEFVWFLLAEEDKRHPTSIEYWFRCMDLDGDGVISMYEMEYFHEEQMNKMETLGIERLPFEDTVCQMMDMVSPRMEGKITLGDLKSCKMTNIFFDTFFNLDKFLEHEQRDPFANARDPSSEPLDVSDWNRYAEEEYDILVADEGNADIDEGNYEDDFEPEDDEELIRDEMLRLAETGPPQRAISQPHATEDIYDFSNTSSLGY